MNELRTAALAQEQAEPVTGLDMFLDPQDELKPKRYKPKAEPAQEPVAWMSDSDVGFDKSEFGATPTVPLYTAPPRRTMVPLTDEEIERIAMTHQSLRQVARAIEKALWEKNQ